MARAKTLKFTDLLVEIETDTPGTYAKPCGFRSRGFNRSATTNENEVPDCTDESLPAVIERDIIALSAEVSGSGVLDRDNLELWDDWFESGQSRNVRVTIVGNIAANGRSYLGLYKLTQLNWSGERGSRVTNEATMQSDGAVVRTPAAA